MKRFHSLNIHRIDRLWMIIKKIVESKMYEVKDKVFLITGGAAGIGAGMTRAFLKEGAKFVAVLDINKHSGTVFEKELASIYGENKIKFYLCDVTTDDLDTAYDAVVKQFGYIDVVVNCAGVLKDSPDKYKTEININLTAVITSSLKAYNLMRKDREGKGGTIVNISSITALHQFPAASIYSATKSAVLQFSLCLGDDSVYFPTSGVRIVTLCFGVTETNLLISYEAIDQETIDRKLIEEIRASVSCQSVESAVAGALEAFKHGSSGSTWLITSGKPAKDISDNIKKAYEIMSQGVFD